ncbi:hypothetical protein Goklo_028017 [Gossypium klotzschianum]|uniref:DUF4283 domain-containing protein n=1 Tax=Gossypium klotzschianum TaxID=34286 RepID=A0A7J8U014_9ROSI|nr:hypothetical protein [Gossypium klotzschianum]
MDLNSVFVEIDLCLVGCFLTASVIHFPAMRSTMANLWHPVKRAQILDLGEEMFLFKFFHKMDLERVLKGSPWTFNNHLLMLHWLEKKEDPLKVPLIFVCFWVQIHEVPPGFYIETLTRQIEGFLGNFLEFDGTNLGKRLCTYLRIRVQLDVRRPLKRKKKVIFLVGLRWVRIYHCELNLEDPLQRAVCGYEKMGKGAKRGNTFVDRDLGRRIDPMLGVNLERDLNLVSCLDGGHKKYMNRWIWSMTRRRAWLKGVMGKRD